MDAKEAADFLRISESEFKRMAPGLPRHAVTERRYIYLRSELLTWLLGRQRRRVASVAAALLRGTAAEASSLPSVAPGRL
jgi:hypothetical protein